MTRRDAAAAVVFALEQEEVCGPVNVAAPGSVTNRQFTAALGAAMGRPTLLPMPAFLLRLALGRMADETLLASARAVPARLTASGFRFRDPALGPALERMLAAPGR